MTDGAHIDGFLIGYGGWIDEDTEDPDAFVLAGTVFRAEAEYREGGWDALAVVLDHVVDGRLVWPVEAPERAVLFEAVWRLGWMDGGVAPTGAPDG